MKEQNTRFASGRSRIQNKASHSNNPTKCYLRIGSLLEDVNSDQLYWTHIIIGVFVHLNALIHESKENDFARVRLFGIQNSRNGSSSLDWRIIPLRSAKLSGFFVTAALINYFFHLWAKTITGCSLNIVGFFHKFCDFSELCQFCFIAGVLPAWCVYTLTPRENRKRQEYAGIF